MEDMGEENNAMDDTDQRHLELEEVRRKLNDIFVIYA